MDQNFLSNYLYIQLVFFQTNFFRREAVDRDHCAMRRRDNCRMKPMMRFALWEL